MLGGVNNIQSNIFQDTHNQLSCATPIVNNIENAQNLDYVVGEEIEGGITLPEFNIWMEELLGGQDQDEGDGQVQHRDGQGDGGQGDGAVRTAVCRI